MFEQTKALCDHFLELGIPGFDLMVCHNGECVFRYMRGTNDAERKTPVNGKEKYHIYSCSKPITCVAAMQLWEKGMFDLEDKLSDYMPAFRDMTVETPEGLKKAKNPILIRHLFQMTSGMSYQLRTPQMLEYYETNTNGCPTVETVNRLAKNPLEFEPGEGWKYSLSHDVLAALVEVLSGEKFELYVKKHIFDPLGMTHSDFLHDMNDWEGFACKFHRVAETGAIEPYYANSYRPGPGYASGGAGCTSTVEDYMKFLEALRVGDVILKKETIAMMATDLLTEKQREMYTYGTEAIGYGLGLRAPRGKSYHTEFGWAGACGAYCSVDPVNNITFYYSQHVNNNPNRHLRRYLYTAIRGDILGEKVFVPIHSEDEDPTLTY